MTITMKAVERTVIALTIATLTLVGFVYTPSRVLAYEPMDSAIPAGITISGDVNSCYQTVNEAFVQLQGAYMKVADKYNYFTGLWTYKVMSDADWVDSVTDNIRCDYPTDVNNGWMYVDPSNQTTIHLSPAVFSGDSGYTHQNHIKDIASQLTHEARHEEQMKSYGFYFRYIDRHYVEWNAMTVEAGVKRVLNWTNNEDAQGSYETFLHYRYYCSVYHAVMPMYMQHQLGFVQHLYTDASAIKCNPADYKDPSLI